MGILSSLYTGITGVQGQGEALAIYGTTSTPIRPVLRPVDQSFLM